MPANARLPIPGNAEFLLYVVALILAMLVCWISDNLDVGSWFSFFELHDGRVHPLARGREGVARPRAVTERGPARALRRAPARTSASSSRSGSPSGIRA